MIEKKRKNSHLYISKIKIKEKHITITAIYFILNGSLLVNVIEGKDEMKRESILALLERKKFRGGDKEKYDNDRIILAKIK